MIVKNIIFDLDNTLYSCTSKMDSGITNRMMAAVADFFDVPLDKAIELRKKNLPGFSTTLEWLRSEGLTDVESYFKKVHPENEADELPFDPNLRPLLESIGQKKIVLTNAPREHADRVLKKLGVAHLFCAVVDIRDCALLGKPYPKSYSLALERLGGTVDDTIFLDDQYKYTAGYQRLGGVSVLVGQKNGTPVKDFKEPVKIPSIYFLPDLLNKLQEM